MADNEEGAAVKVDGPKAQLRLVPTFHGKGGWPYAAPRILAG
jgi:hypothetical protein